MTSRIRSARRPRNEKEPVRGRAGGRALRRNAGSAKLDAVAGCDRVVGARTQRTLKRVNRSGPTYSATTRGIDVEVVPFYLADRSEPAEQRWVWGYRITIANNSDAVIQVLARHWRITDGLGRLEEVQGPGVVGEQPELRPGDSFQYTSGCPLRTPSGIMVGSYTVRDGDGAFFDVDVPAFSLDLPDTGRSLN